MKVLESGIDRCLSNQQQVVSTPNLLSRLVEYVVSQDQGKDMMMTLGFLRLLVSLTNGNVRATEIIGARQDSLNKCNLRNEYFGIKPSLQCANRCL